MKLSTCFILVVFASFSFVACKKSAADYANEANPVPGGDNVSLGNFMRSSHDTRGTARVVTDTISGKKYLVFENFRTDNGPDLRVWMSRSTSASQSRELGKLTAVSGNFSYELTPDIDPLVFNHVLIWCEDFSVLFGYAILR